MVKKYDVPEIKEYDNFWQSGELDTKYWDNIGEDGGLEYSDGCIEYHFQKGSDGDRRSVTKRDFKKFGKKNFFFSWLGKAHCNDYSNGDGWSILWVAGEKIAECRAGDGEGEGESSVNVIVFGSIEGDTLKLNVYSNEGVVTGYGSVDVNEGETTIDVSSINIDIDLQVGFNETGNIHVSGGGDVILSPIIFTKTKLGSKKTKI